MRVVCAPTPLIDCGRKNLRRFAAWRKIIERSPQPATFARSEPRTVQQHRAQRCFRPLRERVARCACVVCCVPRCACVVHCNLVCAPKKVKTELTTSSGSRGAFHYFCCTRRPCTYVCVDKRKTFRVLVCPVGRFTVFQDTWVCCTCSHPA